MQAIKTEFVINKIDKTLTSLVDFGADNRNRTCTELPQLAPEASASASSAISAYILNFIAILKFCMSASRQRQQFVFAPFEGAPLFGRFAISSTFQSCSAHSWGIT